MMNRRILFALLLALTACATKPAPDKIGLGVLLPEDYRQTFIQYARVDREDQTIRELYIAPDALDLVRASRFLANGTVIVIEGYHALLDDAGEPVLDAEGHYVKGEPLEMVHVIEKRPDWTAADFTTEARTTGAGDWNFGSYQFDSPEKFDEDLSACFNCHNSTQQTDFVYTYPLLLAYARTGEVQYFYCDISGRVACDIF